MIFKRNKILFFCLVSFLSVVLLSGCIGDKNKESVQTEFVRPVFAVNTTVAVKGQIQDYISLSGDIIAGSTVDTFSEAAGKITRVNVSVGQRVTRGQTIASVDPSRPGLTFRQSTVTAPISGTIVALPAQVGMTVSQAVPLARISGDGALEIRLYIAERFISKMAMNLPCIITLDAWPGETFQGSITELSPTIDLASRTMEVRVNVADSRARLKPGMFAKVKIVTEAKHDIVKIPASAMLSRFGEQYVFVVVKDPESAQHSIVRKKNVVPGILVDGVLEIQRGLDPDDEVVARGQTLLEDGVRVNVIERMTPVSAN